MMNNQDLSTEDAIIEALTLICNIDGYKTKRYFNKEGELHRIHGPAVITSLGSKHWFKNDKRHREDGPAVMYYDGAESWHINGKRHREDGPAYINPASDYEEYYINDIQFSKEQFIQWQKDNGIK